MFEQLMKMTNFEHVFLKFNLIYSRVANCPYNEFLEGLSCIGYSTKLNLGNIRFVVLHQDQLERESASDDGKQRASRLIKNFLSVSAFVSPTNSQQKLRISHWIFNSHKKSIGSINKNTFMGHLELS
jgi:hypothetical protein